MAAVSSSTGVTFLLLRNRRSTVCNLLNCSFRFRSNSCRFATVRINKSSPGHQAVPIAVISSILYMKECLTVLISLFLCRDLIALSATPETAGTPAFSDNPWLSLIAVLFVSVPLIRKLLELTKEVDTAAQTVARIGVTVGKVAEDVDRAREDIAKALVDLTSGLKKVVTTVEVLAKDTIKDGEKVDDLIDKVDELEEKLDVLLGKQHSGDGEA